MINSVYKRRINIQRKLEIFQFSYDNDIISLEYYKDGNTIKVVNNDNTKDDRIDYIINHINKLQYDLLLNNIGCLCCFSSKDSDNKNCSHCLKKIDNNFFSIKKRCRGCYSILCSLCFNYAEFNLKYFQDLIIYLTNT
jgi:hypothetical protein